MARLPVPGGDNGDWGDILNAFLGVAHKSNGYLQDGIVTIDAIATDTVVDLTSDQTVDGVKTFTDSPVVPTPTTDYQAATKAYVDVNTSTVMAGNTTGADPGTAIAIDSINGTAGYTVANSDGAIAIGYDGTNAANATAQDSIALGAGAQAEGQNSIAIGPTAMASEESSTAIGWDAQAILESDVAIGGGLYSESGGQGAYANGPYALALGTSSATGQQSIAIGSSTANGEFTTSIGFNNIAQSDEYAEYPTTAVGSDNQVGSQNAVAIGQSNYIDSSSSGCAALGLAASINSSNSSLSINSNINGGTQAIAINGNINNASNSLAISGVVNGGLGISGAVAIGMDYNGNQATASNQNDFILGTSSHNVDVPGALEIDGTLQVPTSAPTTPQDGQIWITADGLYFQTNGSTYGPFINP